VVRHTAAAPAVDVRAGGDPLLEGLTNPNEASAAVPAGTVSADVTLAGQSDPVIGPADLELVAGQVTIVYAIGSAAEDTLELLVQTLSTPGGAPGGVGAGTGGQAEGQLPLLVLALAGLGVLVAGASGARLIVARR